MAVAADIMGVDMQQERQIKGQSVYSHKSREGKKTPLGRK